MEGPRAPLIKELPQVLEFLNSNLRPESKWSIDHEYPTALSPANIGNIRIITEGNKVLSHAVLKPLIIKTPLLIFKVGAIGSVVTDNQHRGQGLSKQILQECINESKRQDCDIAMLWTNLYDFYRKLDFELAGYEESIQFTEEFSVPHSHLKFMKSNQVSAEAIHRLYNQHTVGSVRSIDEVRKFMSIPNTNVYTAWDEKGQLAAYAVEGKGADLSGYIHEWGGNVSKILALFSWIRKEKKAPFTVILAQHSLNLLTALKSMPGIIHNEGYLGMIKIINEENLFNKIRKAARTVGISNFLLEKKSGKYLVGTTEDAIEFSDEKDLVRILFGPTPEIPNLKKDTLETLDRIFPLHLWIWGWDSI